MEHDHLIACHECDALFQKPRLGRRRIARCQRCGAMLYWSASGRLDGITAMTVAALITFLIAQGFPIVELETNGITSQTSLLGAIVALWDEQMQVVAIMVFCSTVLFPLTELLALLYLLLPIRAGIVPPLFNPVLRAIQFVRPWGMIEVFMLGVLVTMVKMVSLARVIPEAAMFAFGALTLMFVVVVTFDPRTLWDVAEGLDVLQARRERHAREEEARAVDHLSDAGDNNGERGTDAPGVDGSTAPHRG